MFWTEEVLERALERGPQVINDSKTPSGHPHVGSLRGALIHDALYKRFKEKGLEVKYIFGSDDYDPIDEIPKGKESLFQEHLGLPICNAPAPHPSKHSDMGTHFIKGFFNAFDQLGIEAETYRMRDVYRSGAFNQVIETILDNTKKIRAIYKKVSHSEKPDHWHPFQPICERCGKIATTETNNFDGKEVTYYCNPNLVAWAKGCGYKGKISPYNGNGKLPWKLEWVAKWQVFQITVEGAGMDHTTKGGSREVAAEILRTVFESTPPTNVPYGFFLVEGSKMSSSKGIGASAESMCNFLPAEILRFLMLSVSPKRAINFSPTDKYITKTFNTFDKITQDAITKSSEDALLAKHILSVCIPNAKYQHLFKLSFPLLKTLVQLPHINISDVARNMKGTDLTKEEEENLTKRVEAVQYWIKHFATEDDVFKLQSCLPSTFYKRASILQLGFLDQLSRDLKKTPWSAELIQSQIFNSARLTPLPPKEAFKAIYLAFLDKEKGPIAGSFLFHLGQKKVLNQIDPIDIDKKAFFRASSISLSDITTFFEKEKDLIKDVSIIIEEMSISFMVTNKDKKRHQMRMLASDPQKEASSILNDIMLRFSFSSKLTPPLV